MTWVKTLLPNLMLRYLLLQICRQAELPAWTRGVWKVSVGFISRESREQRLLQGARTSEHTHPEQPKEFKKSCTHSDLHIRDMQEAGLDDYMRNSVHIRTLARCHLDILTRLTLNTNVSLKTGFSVFLCTLVSNFFFFSGRSWTLT